METLRAFGSSVSVEMSTVVLVKNRCQFCHAFFNDPEKIAEHSYQCKFRFSETFEAFDGKMKFACAVCFDVFQTKADHGKHERLHVFPGGFPCSVCDEKFLNNFECIQHMQNTHEVFATGQRDEHSASNCFGCGAFFEQKSYLRLHNETNCGRFQSWRYRLCCPNFLTEGGIEAHMQMRREAEESDAKIEKTLDVSDDISSTRNMVEIDNSRIATSDSDPLLLTVKTETNSGADAENIDFAGVKSGEEDLMENEHNGASIRSGDSVDVGSSVKRRIDASSIKSFACKYCTKKYWERYKLQKHLKVHGPDLSLVHECDLCHKFFSTDALRVAHMNKEHKERLKCKICAKEFFTRNSLFSHIRYHHKDRKRQKTMARHNENGSDSKNSLEIKKNFSCSLCERTYKSHITLTRHLVKHGPDGRLVHKCDCCPIHFESAALRDAHHIAEHKEKMTCKVCDKYFHKYSTLREHFQMHPEKSGPKMRFLCAKCGISYSSKINLETHEQSDCGRLFLFECDICGKCFASKGTLIKHMNTVHLGKRKFARVRKNTRTLVPIKSPVEKKR